MDEKTKLYVFAKKEVALIFVFMILIAITSFIFGVKLGRSYTFEDSSLEYEDRTNINLLSSEEEKVNKIIEEKNEEASAPVKVDDLNKRVEEKLREELARESQGEEVSSQDNSATASPNEEGRDNFALPAGNERNTLNTPGTQNGASITQEEETIAPPAPKDQLTGKHTIQLGSYRTLKEAEEFAEGFKGRGYNPIINEVEISTRGVWYRVSIGAFETRAEAIDFVAKEETLFRGQDYVFTRFD